MTDHYDGVAIYFVLRMCKNSTPISYLILFNPHGFVSTVVRWEYHKTGWSHIRQKEIKINQLIRLKFYTHGSHSAVSNHKSQLGHLSNQSEITSNLEKTLCRNVLRRWRTRGRSWWLATLPKSSPYFWVLLPHESNAKFLFCQWRRRKLRHQQKTVNVWWTSDDQHTTL